MNVEIRRLGRDDRHEWNRCVEQSPGTNFFHQYEALRVLADHAGMDVHPLAGYAAGTPIGVFPVFERSVGPLTAVLSPPPNLRVPYLGPATLNVAGLDPWRREALLEEFVEGSLRWIDDRLSAGYVHVRTDTHLTDVRPFQRNGFDLTPRYTYVLDLTPSEETLLSEFSSDARRNIGRNDGRVQTRVETDRTALRRIIEQVRARYTQQGISYDVTPEFVVDLYERMPEGQVRPYVCRHDGEFVGGIVVLAYGDSAYRWQGGVKCDEFDYPANDNLDWQIVRESKAEGRTQYDLVGANNQRINRYKAKFGPELRVYYSAERRSRTMGLLAGLYKRFR